MQGRGGALNPATVTVLGRERVAHPELVEGRLPAPGVRSFRWGTIRAVPLRRKILLSVAALAFGLLILEWPAFLGLVDYRLALRSPAALNRLPFWENPRFEIDSNLLSVRRPGRVQGETPGDLALQYGLPGATRYSYDLQYDGNGFLNDRDLTEAPIVAIGDSFLEHGLVAHRDTVTVQLSDALGVDVANLGRARAAPRQEVTVLRDYGLPLHPRLVLWFFFEGNDLAETVEYETVLAAGLNRSQFSQRSFTGNLARGLFELAGGPTRAAAEAGRRRSCQIGSDTLYFAYPGHPLNASDLEGWRIAQGYLREAHALTRQAGASFLLIHAPTKYRVYHDRCTWPDDGEGRRWSLSDLPSRLEAFAAEQGMGYLDLTAALRHAATDGLVFFPDDSHWNGAGQRAAAHALVIRMKAGMAVATPPAPP